MTIINLSKNSQASYNEVSGYNGATIIAGDRTRVIEDAEYEIINDDNDNESKD